MDKTLLKRRIAREWLILLGSIGVGLIVLIVLYIVGYSLDYQEYEKQLSQWNEYQAVQEKEYEKKLSEWEKDHPEKEKEYEKWQKDHPALWGIRGIPHEPWNEPGSFEENWGRGKQHANQTDQRSVVPFEQLWQPQGVEDSWAYWAYRPKLPVSLGRPSSPSLRPLEPSDISIWLIVFFPYIIIQFIRSIIWARKQVLLKC